MTEQVQFIWQLANHTGNLTKEQRAKLAELSEYVERLQTHAQDKLESLMSDHSEDAWAAQWLGGIEHSLWVIVVNKGGDWGMKTFTAEEAEELRQLAEDAGGWYSPSDGFVDMQTWLKEYGGESLSPNEKRCEG